MLDILQGVRIRHASILAAAALAAAVLMTWPLATGLGHLGRTQNSGDGRFAVWNVAWVAHALVTNPADLFDANIFYPHRQALAFSEANIGAGTLAVPVWVATRNPFAAHNSVVLFAFAASVAFMWLLVRRLTGDGGAAATSAVLFAFCPYVFSHTAHIQLLMVAGIPLCLLAFHRLVDAPSPARGVALGLALAAQAMSCAYYGVSAGLTVGYATLFYAWSRRLWTSRPFWIAIAIAAAASIGIVLPFFLPYLQIQADTGFARPLDETQQWSAYVRSYLASAAHAHVWMLPLIRDWNRAVLFPGFLSIALAVAGTAVTLGRRGGGAVRDHARLTRDRETAILYGSIAILTFWASLGPRAGLYTVLHNTIPIFSFLRAPERMGIVVVLCLAVLAAYAVRALRRADASSPNGDCRRLLRGGAHRTERHPLRLAAGRSHSRRLPSTGRKAARANGRVPVLQPADRLPPAHPLHAEVDGALAAAREWLQRSHSGRVPDAGERARYLPVEGKLRRDARSARAISDAESGA